MKRVTKSHNYSNLITDLASLIEQGRGAAARYMNTALVTTYWLIGRRIVKYEQKGKERAEYGKSLLKKISTDLTNKYGKGFGYINLNLMRQFYLTYPPQKILQTVSEESTDKKKTVVEYALGGMNNKVFASKYKLQLPDPKILKTEIEHEKQRLLEMKIVK